MRGLVDQTDQDSEKNMIPPKADKRSGKCSMRRKVRTRAESGTCNVCSAPCSSCMHLKLAHVGFKGGELTDETCHTAAMSQNSINNNQQHTISEASNLHYANSSHDSLSENAESKVKIESLDVVDTSVDLKIVPKRVEQLSTKLQSSTEKRTFSNKLEDSKLIEGLDDNSSCVSRANVESTVVSYCCMNIVKRNILGNSDPVSGGSGQEECAAATSDAVNCENSGGENTTAKNTVKAAGKIFLESETEDKDCRNRPGEVLECTDQSGPKKKFDMSVELPNMQEPALHSLSGNESDESEIIEHDVKVCDICGDAGREDLLAICSQCSDGAEHTYCMREMLQKVPEGNWLCEECKLAEEVDNQQQGADAEGKTTTKGSIWRSGKRHAETTEVLSSKKQAIETSSGSLKTSSLSRAAALSRESSFRSLDKGTLKPDYHNSVVNQSTIDVSETAHHPSSGALSKSNSFNTLCSKPKARLVDEVPQKVKVAKEHSSLDVKEGPARNMNKLMSFKSVNSGRANASESKVKMLSSNFPHTQEMKGLKSMRDCIAFERKTSLSLDRPLGNSMAKVNQKLTLRGDGSVISSVSNSKELKILQSDGKLGNLSRSDSSVARRGTELPVLSAQALSANGTDNASTDSRINQVSTKDEPSSSSSGAAEKSSKKDDENFPECSPRARESMCQSEKTKESSVSCSTLSDPVSLRDVTHQKCKGVDHVAEYCTVSSRVIGVDATMTRSVRGEVNKGSKLKAAIEAAILKKPGICRKKQESEQLDGLSSSNVGGSVRIASEDQVPAFNKIKDIKSNGETTEERVGSGMSPSESCKQSSGNLAKQLNGRAVDGSVPVKAEDMDPVLHAVGKSNASTSTAYSFKMLVIPKSEYIWQGAFEVCKSGRYSEWCGGIQAHLSTSASLKVLEVVKRFPQNLILDEVPRLSTWPRQFYVDGAKDDNIALFFFSKDVESFEKYYNGLLNNMIRKDLALKASLDGVDLLIFPSTQLPESSQRWNTLFFVWGVFSGRRPDCSESVKKSVVSDPDEVPLNNPKSSAVIFKDDDSCLPTPVDKETSVSDSSSEKVPASDAPSKQCAQSNGDSDKKFSNFLSSSKQQFYTFDSKYLSKSTKSPLFCTEARSISPPHEEVDLVECKSDVELEFSCQATGAFDSNDKEETQMKRDVSRDRDDASSSRVCSGANRDLCSRGSYDVEKTRLGIHCEKIEVQRDLNEENENMDTEGSLRDLNSEAVENEILHSTSRKRQYLDLSEVAPPTSGSMSDKMQLSKVCTTWTESESISKKSKTDFSGLYASSSSRDGITFGNRLASQACDLASSSSSEEKSCAKVHHEVATLETLGTNERHFFPLDSDNPKSFQSEGSFMPCKDYSSNDIHRLSDGVPNLELALGAEKKSENKGMLSFFVGMADKNKSHNKPLDKTTNKEEEDDSASLSLSLSCLSPNEEPSRKPEPKRGQLLPDRRHVNASLFLFGGFSDKYTHGSSHRM